MLVKSFGGFLVHASIVSELIMTALRIQVTNIFRPLVSVLLSVLYSNRNSGNSKPKGICVKKNGSLPIIDHTYTKFFPRPVPHIFTYTRNQKSNHTTLSFDPSSATRHFIKKIHCYDPHNHPLIGRS